MTNEPQDQDIGIELNKRWGAIFGSAQMYIIQLEREKEALVNQVSEMSKREKDLIEKIKSLKEKLITLNTQENKKTLDDESIKIVEEARKIINPDMP